MPAERNIPEEDIADAKGMLDRGDLQHDIAAYYGVNNARVNELSRNSTPYARKYAHIPATPIEQLRMPRGPHPGAREFYARLAVAEMVGQAASGLAEWRIKIVEDGAVHEINRADEWMNQTEATNTELRAENTTLHEQNKALRTEFDKLKREVRASIADMAKTAKEEIDKLTAERDHAQGQLSQAWGAAKRNEHIGRDAKAENQELRSQIDKMAKTVRVVAVSMEELGQPPQARRKNGADHQTGAEKS